MVMRCSMLFGALHTAPTAGSVALLREFGGSSPDSNSALDPQWAWQAAETKSWDGRLLVWAQCAISCVWFAVTSRPRLSFMLNDR
jgi:hypothetical protein